MNILIACEESQTVLKEFLKKGHNAYSCDIKSSSGGIPERHIKEDVLKILEPRKVGIVFTTENKEIHYIKKWDMIIAHPPCTRLCNTGQRWLYTKNEEYNKQKKEEQKKAIEFFMKFTKLSCKKVVIENPVGIMSSLYRKPDVIYNPYDFENETEQKTTCLWLKGVEKLKPTRTTKIKKEEITFNLYKGIDKNGKQLKYGSEEIATLRSKTPIGVAKAMAEQWGVICKQ